MVVGCATHKSLDNFRASSYQKYAKGRKSHTISIKMSEAFKEQRVHIGVTKLAHQVHHRRC